MNNNKEVRQEDVREKIISESIFAVENAFAKGRFTYPESYAELYQTGAFYGYNLAKDEPTPTESSSKDVSGKGVEEGFKDYMREARDSFVKTITDYFPHEGYQRYGEGGNKIRVAAEDILICFDQMRERLLSPATVSNGSLDELFKHWENYLFTQTEGIGKDLKIHGAAVSIALMAIKQGVEKLLPVSNGEAVDGWLTEKPEFKENCILLTATFIRDEWSYNSWLIEKINHGEGWYWGWMSLDGDEYGDLADLKAGRYKIVKPIN